MLKACAFDLGNTLVNDVHLLEETTAEMDRWLKHQGFLAADQPFASVYMAVNRRNNKPFVSHTYGELTFFEETLRELGITGLSPGQALDRYRKMLLRNLHLEPRVVETLRRLRERGLQTALLTNESSERVEALLEHTGSREMFDEVIVSQEIGFEKPDPRIFLEALKRLGVEAEELIMFGDNEIADGGCKQLGITFVLVTEFKREGWGWERGDVYRPDYCLQRIEPDSVIPLLETAFPAASGTSEEDQGGCE